MNQNLAQRLRQHSPMTFIRKHHILAFGLAGAALIILLVTHVDIRQALMNPMLLLIGGIIIALHVLAVLVITFVTRKGRKRWNR